MKSFKAFFTEEYNPNHPDEMHHVREFHKRIAQHYPHGLIVYHESPGHVADSFRKHGIEGEYGVFGTINEPSNFVTGKKTIVKFRLPPQHNNPDYIHPDMRYEGDEGAHKALMKEHPHNLTGADVSLNYDRVHPRHILSIEEK